MYKPNAPTKDFLRIVDLRVNYEVTYLIDYDQDFVSAAKDIFSQKIVGFDGEYRMGTIDNNPSNLPSYIQISTQKQGYVFNVEKLAKNQKCLEAMWEMCASKDILKVGHSIEQDLQKIFHYFLKKYKINRKILLYTCSIDIDLFTIRPP